MCLRVIDDHVVVFDSGRLVLFSNLTEGVEEQTITEFHDVGFVNTSDFLHGEALEIERLIVRADHTFLPFFKAKSNAKRTILSAL